MFFHVFFRLILSYLPSVKYLRLAMLAAMSLFVSSGTYSLGLGTCSAKVMQKYQHKVDTEHTYSWHGKSIAYTTEVGLTPMCSDQGTELFTLSYIAYKKHGASNTRPVSFLYNGGPGAASMLINFMGTGPTVLNSMQPKQHPHLVNNPSSWLPYSDLVYIDMPGTGWGSPANSKHGFNPYTINNDAKTFAHFIYDYLHRMHQFGAPINLVGESYGGFRSPLVAYHLLSTYNLPTHAMILLSPLLDVSTWYPGPGNNIPYAAALPSVAAVYQHQKKTTLDPQAILSLEHYAFNQYWPALSSSNGPNQAMLAKISHLTGISIKQLLQHHGRLSASLYGDLVAFHRGRQISLLDGRISGEPLYHGEVASFPELADPFMTQLSNVMTTPVLSYIQKEYKYNGETPYQTANFSIYAAWQWQNSLMSLGAIDVINIMHNLLVSIPGLRVYVASGYYDLEVPFAGVRYSLNQLELPSALNKHIQFDLYPTGHVVYENAHTRARLLQAVHTIIA